ncbi:hypothetical protein [Sessilibacter corallicola]|uniref:Isopropylmalate isomerase n=1 Tax=Sessilibacter corallicola TaxID=2904075 RepID=A0ABQ0A7T6_9GAMM
MNWDTFTNLNIHWHPTIGDPTPAGWLTVGLYLFSALLALVITLNSHKVFFDEQNRQKAFWFIASLVLLFLSVNKQLDLQTLFTELARAVAIEQGWYKERKIIQKLFILGIFVLSIILSIYLIYFFRKSLKYNLVAILGISLVLTFVIIRATSFHASDVLINYRLFNLKMNWILECSGIVLIIINEISLLSRFKTNTAEIPTS